jgi:xanthine dehydrogenase YagS FAD-binding subunit
MRTFHLDRPRSVADTIELLAADPQARLIAGGTDLVTLMRDGIESPGRLVDVSGLGLDRIDELPDGAGLRIGAMCRNAMDDRRLRDRYPVVAQALRSGASPQIRTMATFGGNLLQRVRCPYFRQPEFACNRRDPGSGCPAIAGDSSHQAVFGGSSACTAVHPSDLAVALLAVDAVVRVEGPAGPRGIPIGELHRLPGDTPHAETTLEPSEMIVAIDLPPSSPTSRSHYLKVRDRASFAFALVSAAVVVEEQGGRVRSARVALGGVAPKPWRAAAAEEALAGRALDDPAITAAAEAATSGARPLRDNGYKVELIRRVVRRALTELGGQP